MEIAMGKLVLQMQMSVDGRMSAAAPGVRWQLWDFCDPWTWDQELRQFFNDVLASVDCILLSRPMARQGYLSHWGSLAERHAADSDFAFARRILEIDKVIATRTLTRSTWDRTSIAAGPLQNAVLELKRRARRDIIAFGGVGLAASLIGCGCVDELQLFINPAAVGDGPSIFSLAEPGLKLRLLGSRAFACGIVVTRYAPQGRPATKRRG
jgi:dihydrofolate reductase